MHRCGGNLTFNRCKEAMEIPHALVQWYFSEILCQVTLFQRRAAFEITHYSYESKIDYLTRISEEKDYMAPYDRIEKGCRLVLYGAGKVGKSYYKQLLSAQYCNIVLVVDKSGADAGEGIRNVNEISQTDYDYILVAIKKRSLALAAIDFLKKEFSVDDDRIINVI